MITSWLQHIESEVDQNLLTRHNVSLQNLADYIVAKRQTGEKANLIFICTHNSRRSQFAQTWCKVVQEYFNLDIVNSYSGGTEVTACDPRTVQSLERAGLQSKKEGEDNPVYTITAEELSVHVKLWSKLYDDESTPSEHFAAVMTCSHADANCPFIPGAEARIPLTYTDPKHADGTEYENDVYDSTCKMIATDIMRLFKLAQSELN